MATLHEHQDEYIRVKRCDLVEVYRQLELLVVSLDHIESAFPECSEEEKALVTLRFVQQWGVLGRLADARFILDGYFPRDPGPDGMDDLQRELLDMRCWSSSEPNPSVT